MLLVFPLFTGYSFLISWVTASPLLNLKMLEYPNHPQPALHPTHILSLGHLPPPPPPVLNTITSCWTPNFYLNRTSPLGFRCIYPIALSLSTWVFNKHLKLNVAKIELLIYTFLSPLYLSIWHDEQSPHCMAQNLSSSTTNCPGLPGTCPGFSSENPMSQETPQSQTNRGGGSAYLGVTLDFLLSHTLHFNQLDLPPDMPSSHLQCHLAQASITFHLDHPNSLFIGFRASLPDPPYFSQTSQTIFSKRHVTVAPTPLPAQTLRSHLEQIHVLFPQALRDLALAHPSTVIP